MKYMQVGWTVAGRNRYKIMTVWLLGVKARAHSALGEGHLLLAGHFLCATEGRFERYYGWHCNTFCALSIKEFGQLKVPMWVIDTLLSHINYNVHMYISEDSWKLKWCYNQGHVNHSNHISISSNYVDPCSIEQKVITTYIPTVYQMSVWV